MNKKPNLQFSAFKGIAAIFLAFTIFVPLGYYTAGQIFKLTSRPPEGAAVLIYGFTSGLIFLFFILFIYFSNRSHLHNHKHDSRWSMYGDMLEALSQIAQGNFDVFLNPDDRQPHHEIANAINDMAKNLGNLESMRQDFISNVSHEIQSPLTSISGFAALLKNDKISEDQKRRYAEIIENESRRLSSMSEKLLNLSTLENGVEPLTYKEYRLDKQLEHALLTLEPQWVAKKLSVEVELEMVTVRGDEGLLSQVWINLINNAIKFTPEDGKISASLKKDGDMVCCQIKDTGVGLSPEEQLHVFERFYKADKSRDRALSGNGLGLAIVKKITELHGGQVSVKSVLGKGSIFSIRLP